MDLESLEKQKKELKQIREDLASRLADFEAKQGQDLSEEQLKGIQRYSSAMDRDGT